MDAFKNPKLLAAALAVLLALLTGGGAVIYSKNGVEAHSGVSSSSEIREDIATLKEQGRQVERRLESIEEKIDRLLMDRSK